MDDDDDDDDDDDNNNNTHFLLTIKDGRVSTPFFILYDFSTL